MSSSMASWTRLPSEIRYLILDLLLYEGDFSLAGLATVSKEWHAAIEPYNFSRISLTPSRLSNPDSRAILDRKRCFIHYIWFRLELQRYDCTECVPGRGHMGLHEADNVFIAEAFPSLFSALSQWELNGDLILDISVYSPSDSEHFFKYLDFEPDTPPCQSSGTFPLQQGEIFPWTTPDDPRHGWAAGLQETAPSRESIYKVFDEIMGEGPFEREEPEMEWWQQLPSVPAISGLLLRQQTRRRWKPTALSNMLSRFPNLKEMFYEPWREWGSMELCTDRHNRTLIESLSAGANLRKLVIFESFNEQYPSRFFECDEIRVTTPFVSHKLVRASLPLETLCASFMVDAGYFFEEAVRRTSWRWQNLTSLALTSRLLDPDVSTAVIDGMLLDAATAALNMPKLETMEIWNGRRGLAILFRYETARNEQSALITLRGTFQLALRPTVARAWDEVALRHGHGRIVVRSSWINADMIRSHGDALCHLGLSAQVIRPVSLRQILKEHQVRSSTVFMAELSGF